MAKLTEASLNFSDFQEADLTLADFTKVDLRGAVLIGCNMLWTDFSDTEFDDDSTATSS